MKILNDTSSTRAQYAELVEHSQMASVYQTLEWLLVFDSLSYHLKFVQVDADTIVPFVCTGSGPFERAYSSPYDTYGGPVTQKSSVSGSATAPGDRIGFDELARVLRVPTIRVVDFGGRLSAQRAIVEEAYTHVLRLADYDEIKRGYSKRNREALRQGERRGIEITAADTEEDVQVFRRLYEHTSGQHGTRPLPTGFFPAVHRLMSPKGLARFYFASHEGQVIAGHLVLKTKDEFYAWGLGYDDTFLQLRPANALIDRGIRDAIADGAKHFNLGTSPSSGRGILRFKESFGAEPVVYRILRQDGTAFKMVRRFVRSNKWLSSKF